MQTRAKEMKKITQIISTANVESASTEPELEQLTTADQEKISQATAPPTKLIDEFDKYYDDENTKEELKPLIAPTNTKFLNPTKSTPENESTLEDLIQILNTKYVFNDDNKKMVNNFIKFFVKIMSNYKKLKPDAILPGINKYISEEGTIKKYIYNINLVKIWIKCVDYNIENSKDEIGKIKIKVSGVEQKKTDADIKKKKEDLEKDCYVKATSGANPEQKFKKVTIETLQNQNDIETLSTKLKLNLDPIDWNTAEAADAAATATVAAAAAIADEFYKDFFEKYIMNNLEKLVNDNSLQLTDFKSMNDFIVILNKNEIKARVDKTGIPLEDIYDMYCDKCLEEEKSSIEVNLTKQNEILSQAGSAEALLPAALEAKIADEQRNINIKERHDKDLNYLLISISLQKDSLINKLSLANFATLPDSITKIDAVLKNHEESYKKDLILDSLISKDNKVFDDADMKFRNYKSLQNQIEGLEKKNLRSDLNDVDRKAIGVQLKKLKLSPLLRERPPPEPDRAEQDYNKNIKEIKDTIKKLLTNIPFPLISDKIKALKLEDLYNIVCFYINIFKEKRINYDKIRYKITLKPESDMKTIRLLNDIKDRIDDINKIKNYFGNICQFIEEQTITELRINPDKLIKKNIKLANNLEGLFIDYLTLPPTPEPTTEELSPLHNILDNTGSAIPQTNTYLKQLNNFVTAQSINFNKGHSKHNKEAFRNFFRGTQIPTQIPTEYKPEDESFNNFIFALQEMIKEKGGATKSSEETEYNEYIIVLKNQEPFTSLDTYKENFESYRTMQLENSLTLSKFLNTEEE